MKPGRSCGARQRASGKGIVGSRVGSGIGIITGPRQTEVLRKGTGRFQTLPVGGLEPQSNGDRR